MAQWVRLCTALAEDQSRQSQYPSWAYASELVVHLDAREAGKCSLDLRLAKVFCKRSDRK